MLSTVATIFFGAVGWLVTWFFFEPIKAIVDLRREAQECLIFHGNLAKNAPADERRAASDAFRHIGVRFVSRHIAAYPWVRWCCTWLGWDIHTAGTLLIGLGNSTQFEDYSVAQFSPNIAHLRRCLKLGAPDPPQVLQSLVEHTGKSGSEDQL